MNTRNRMILLVLTVASATPAVAQGRRASSPTFRAALARQYRSIADSALARVLESYPPGVTQGGNSFPYYATTADARKAVLGGLSAVQLYPFTGPHGEKMAVASFALNDDPSDHGLTTNRTLIFDAAGHVVASAPVYLLITRIAGAKIVTVDGVIRWTGSQWSFPTPPEPVD